MAKHQSTVVAPEVRQDQPKLYEIINQKFEELSENDFQHPKVRRHTTRESNGGRHEYRRYTVFPALPK